MFGLPLPPPPPDDSPQKEPAGPRSTMHSASSSLSPGESPPDAAAADSVHQASLRLHSSLLESSVDEQLALPLTSRQPAMPLPEDDPSGGLTNRSDGLRFAGVDKEEMMSRMLDEIEDDPALVEDEEEPNAREAEEAEQELFLNLQRQQQQQQQQGQQQQGLTPPSPEDEFGTGTPRVDERYYAEQRARIEAQMEEQEAQLAARPDVLAPSSASAAGNAATGGSTSAIISALHLRIAQLESGVASRDAEIDQLQRNLAASKAAAAAAAAKAGPKSPAHATNAGTPTAASTGSSLQRRSSMDGMEGDPGAAPAVPPAAAAAPATPTATTEEDEFEAAIAAEAAAASYGKDGSALSTTAAEESSMGTSILAAVSPATLSYSDRSSKAGAGAGSGVIALKQHHALITSMAIRFDVEFSRLTRSNQLLHEQIEALQKEVKATALHADTMAIEAENAASRSQELTQALIDARQSARDSAVLDGQAFALEVARKEELGRELESMEDALHEEQVRCQLLQGRLDEMSTTNEQLQASQALLVESLREMTAARDQESFDRNELSMKCTALEGEYEKVERILEEYQRAQMMGEQNSSLNSVLFSVPGVTTGRKDAEEKTSDSQQQGGGQESSRHAELYTSRFIPPPSGGSATNAAWLAQHELQHLYFSSEKKKWRAEARNLAAQSEHWKDRYETLQKNHYALVERMERINAKERAKIGQQRRANATAGERPTSSVRDSERSSFSLAGDDLVTLINQNTRAEDGSVAKPNNASTSGSSLSLPPLPSAPAVTAATLVLTDDLASPRSGGTAATSEVHVVAAGEVEAVRAEVRRLIYFLQKNRRAALAERLAPVKKTSSHQLLLSPRNGSTGAGFAAPSNPGDGHSSSLPLLPPMPPTLPQIFVPDFILLEESLRDLSRKLDTSREENANLNSMMQLVMEPWYKIDAEDDAQQARESNALITLQGLAAEVEQREEELAQSLRALDAERKAKEASDAAYEARLDELTQLLADTRTEAGLSSKERSAAHARALEHLRAEIALLQSERTAAQVAANTWEQKYSEEREAHLSSGSGSSGGDSGTGNAGSSEEMQKQLAALQAKHRATLLEREAAHAQSLEAARLLGGGGAGAIQLQAHLDELAALRKTHAQELDTLRAQSAREAAALLAGARPSRIVALTPDDGSSAVPAKKCRFHAQPSASEEQPLAQMDPLAPSKLFVSSTLGLLAPVPAGSSIGDASSASGGSAFLDGSVAALARENRAALEAKQQEVDLLRVSVSTLTTELAHSKLRSSDLEAQLSLLQSLGSDESTLASTNLALERDRVRELSRKVAALELLRSRTMTRAEIELQRVQAQAALNASGSFSPRGSAPANLAALADSQAGRAFGWILNQSRLLGEADPAAAAAVTADSEQEPITSRKTGPVQSSDSVARSSGAPRVSTGEEDDNDEARSPPRKIIIPSSELAASRSAGAPADDYDRASDRVSSSAAASATAAASAAAAAAAAAASAVKSSNDLAASSASRLSEREAQLAAKEAALQALQDHLTSEESLLASLRLRLDHDTASLAKAQADFQSYLAASHRELDARLLAIQNAEASLGTRDAEILSEVSILNQKISEYNRKASELNARTEELKRRRIELREEKLAWANIKTSRMQGIAANLGMGSSLQAASARANIDSAGGAASTAASTMHMHARNVAVAELSQSTPSRFVSPTSISSGHSSASPPLALPALPLPLPPSPGLPGADDQANGRVSPTAAAAAATAAARARAYGSSSSAAGGAILSPSSRTAFSSPPPSATAAAGSSAARFIDFGSSPTSAALFSPMSPMPAHSFNSGTGAAAIKQSPDTAAARFPPPSLHSPSAAAPSQPRQP